MMRLNKKGALKGFGIAQRALQAERKRLAKQGTLPPLRREQAAVKAILKQNPEAVYRSPSRYAHLAGPNRQGAEVLADAVRQSKSQAVAKVADKLEQGIIIESRALAGAGA